MVEVLSLIHLNTYHVKVQSKHFNLPSLSCYNLNTYHVKVQLEDLEKKEGM